MSARLTRLTAAAGLSLVLATGCSVENAVGKAPSPRPSANPGKRALIESEIAHCMKQKGFKYAPAVRRPRKLTEAQRREASGDYAAMKAHRQKYGFDVFSEFVYPSTVPPFHDEWDDQANILIATSLSKTQMTAWIAAFKLCQLKSTGKVLGKDFKHEDDLSDQYGIAEADARERLDAELAEPAAAFGKCLKKKGYKIYPSDGAWELSHRGSGEFLEERRKAYPNGKKPSAAEARPYLNREIKAALDDLECGKNFYPLYLPKEKEMYHQVALEWGKE